MKRNQQRQVGWITLFVFLVVIISVGIYALTYSTAEVRGRIDLHNQQRSATALQFNYEYFHDKCRGIIAETQQIKTLQDQYDSETANKPSSDPFGQWAQTHQQTLSQVTGLKDLRDGDAQDYNSKSHQWTRNFIKSRDLPDEIGAPTGVPYDSLTCEG